MQRMECLRSGLYFQWLMPVRVMGFLAFTNLTGVGFSLLLISKQGNARASETGKQPSRKAPVFFMSNAEVLELMEA